MPKAPPPLAVKIPGAHETDLKKGIQDWLSLRGFYSWIHNVGAVKFRSDSGRDRFVKFGAKGQSDIFVILKGGRLCVIETKMPGKKPTTDQVGFMTEVERLGGIAILAYSLKDVEVRLRAEGYLN